MLYNTVDESVKVSAGIKIWDDGLFFAYSVTFGHISIFFSWYVCI